MIMYSVREGHFLYMVQLGFQFGNVKDAGSSCNVWEALAVMCNAFKESKQEV